ncbi:MAG: arylsulfatase A-like enzyme [Pseudohongiellaceae bacterium]|jgi:arylsulfatase A-like enzyme
MFLFLSSAQMLPPSSDDVDALAQLDRLLDELLQNIDAAFHGEPTLVVLTSDHPRPELRDSAFGGQGLDAATVPLLMRWPPGWRASTQFREGRAAVTTLDVAATILHVAGVETAPAMTGTSLAEH